MSIVPRRSPYSGLANPTDIPPHDRIVLTNNSEGNPTRIVYHHNGVVVAETAIEYDENGFLVEMRREDPSE